MQTQTTTTIHRGDFIQLANGRSGKVCWIVDESECFALMDDKPGLNAELVTMSDIVKVISGR